MNEYANALNLHALKLSQIGDNFQARFLSRDAMEICKCLSEKNPSRYESDYARLLGNYVSFLGDRWQI